MRWLLRPNMPAATEGPSDRYNPPSAQLAMFFFSSRRRHTRWTGDWSSDVCSSDLLIPRTRDARLDMARILREHEPLDVAAERYVDRVGPVGRLVDDEPHDVEVVVLVLDGEAAEPADDRLAAVRADDHIRSQLEGLR